jgi:hypothetical protein
MKISFGSICSFLLIISCAGSLDKSHEFDEILYKCDFNQEIIADYKVISINDSRGNKIYKEHYNIYLFDPLDNLIDNGNVKVSEYSCLAIPRKTSISKIGISHRTKDEGIQRQFDEIQGFEHISLEKIGIDSFSLWSSCGISENKDIIDSERLIIFKITNTDNYQSLSATFSPFTKNLAEQSVSITEKGCLFFDDPVDGVVSIKAVSDNNMSNFS